MKNQFDVIVVGAGHAGVEAGLVCSRMGLKVLLATTKKSRVSYMSCNPSIGGLAKGNLVKEIDVLGGVMAGAGDFACLQFKHLNSKKGPAVRGSRVQCDKKVYSEYIQKYISEQENITLIEEEIAGLYIHKGVCRGVKTKTGEVICAQAVILTTGTFMGAVMHIGFKQTAGGRIGDQATYGISDQLKSLGVSVTRLKTGTPARIHKNSVNWKVLQEQKGDKIYRPLSFFSPQKPRLSSKLCYLTYTNEKTHQVIRENLKQSPLFSGIIQGAGPRYCPSIEDKVVRFPDKTSHQIFLEPEEQNGISIYVQGMSTSLPKSAQEKFLKTIKGLKDVEILQWGYAVEYDFINPIQINATLETKFLPHLYFAGQINGSSGYEEAGAQGLLAGINAGAQILNLPELVLSRSQAYTGVLVDDLVTKGTKEPYRMLTSRAEHRLVLREDNAVERLFPAALNYKLLPPEKIKFFENLLEKRTEYKKRLKNFQWSGNQLPYKMEKDQTYSADQLLKRPEFSYPLLEKIGLPPEKREVAEPVEIEIKYAGYIHRQNQIIQKNQKMGRMSLKNVDYKAVKGLSYEAREKLEQVQPRNLDQAGRILGVGPSAIQALIIHTYQQIKRT